HTRSAVRPRSGGQEESGNNPPDQRGPGTQRSRGRDATCRRSGGRGSVSRPGQPCLGPGVGFARRRPSAGRLIPVPRGTIMPVTINKQRLLTHLFSSLKKRYEPAEPEPRPVLEQLLYAVVREGATREQADRAFRLLQERF